MSKKKNLKHQTVYVEGMHCSSCELLIEKYAISQKGIKSVDASLKDQKVDIYYNNESGIDLKKMNQEFKKQGYSFSTERDIKKSSPLLSLKEGQVHIDREKASNTLKVLISLILVVTVFFLVDKLQLGKYISVDNNLSLSGFLLLGIVAGISTCAALVGGILLSMTKQWNEIYKGESERNRFEPHIMFHLGRIASFTLLGGLLGLLGKTLTFNNTVLGAILVILVSLFMLILALQMLEVKWAQKFRFTLPKSISRTIADEKKYSGKLLPILIGVSTFFLPCGFTLIAQGVALASGSFLRGALVMLFFALGTLIPLASISISGVKINSKPKNSYLFNQISGILLVFFVLYNINSQFNVLGIPSLNDIKFEKTENIFEPTPDNSDTQELRITAQGFEYIPTSSTTIKAGVKTELIVNNTGMQGCGVYIVGRGLFDGYVKLLPGENRITFIPKKGTYKLTCSMGMVPPVLITVK